MIVQFSDQNVGGTAPSQGGRPSSGDLNIVQASVLIPNYHNQSFIFHHRSSWKGLHVVGKISSYWQWCSLALFLNQQFLKMASISTFLLGILPKDQELEKVIWPNIALSTRTGPHTLYNVDYNGAIFQKSFSGNNFWLECPTDLRSTPLSYIFDALFRDTPLGHVYHTQPNSQIAKLAKYLDIWLFGYLAARKNHTRVGYPWKEHTKCSS